MSAAPLPIPPTNLQASQLNRQRIATLPPRQAAQPKRPGADVRERVQRFAQSSLPKPASFRASRGPSAGRGSGALESAAAAAVEAADAGEQAPPEQAAAQPPQGSAGAEVGGNAALPEAVEQVAGQLQGLVLGAAQEAAPAGEICSDAPHAEPPAGC